MYIGSLNYDKALTFTHIDSPLPFVPSVNEEGAYLWRIDEIFDMSVDVTITLERECYVGAVNFRAAKASLAAAEVLADGRVVGARRADGTALFGGLISIPVGVTAQKLTLRLTADFQDVTLAELDILGACEDGVPLVYPTPKSIGTHKGYAKIKEVIAASDDPDEAFAANFLAEGLTERFGAWQSADGVTVLLKKDSSYEDERYTVTFDGKTVTVTASSRLALLYGTDTLLSLTSETGLYLADVDDRPSCRMRGFHFGLPRHDRIDYVRRLLRYVLLPMRYNVIFLEFAGGMRFDRHPEISEGWLDAIRKADAGEQPYMPHSDKVSWRTLLEKDDVRRLVAIIKELGFALIPEVQSLGHVQYITYAHPELAERDENAPNEVIRGEANPSNFYAHSYCPSNPKCYEIMYDIIDEIVEVTEPDGYVHMGHDEVYQLGLCPLCRDKARGALFADHIIAMHDYLAKKGLKMMIWCDMLHPHRNADSDIDRIPRDIVMLDFIWYFRPDSDIENNILKHGFSVAVGNLYSSHYTRPNSRLTKPGMVGGEVSMWIIADEEIHGRNGKLWEMMCLSEMLWNIEGYDGTNRKSYTRLLARHIQPRTRDALRGKLRPGGYTETRLSLTGNTEGVPSELLSLCPDAKNAETATAAVGGAFDRLVFEHATVYPNKREVWKDHVPVGAYLVEYADGTTEEVQVRYAQNVMCYKSGYGTPKHGQYYNHFGYVGTWFADPICEGKTADGADVCITGYVWENPRPETPITRITYKPHEGDFCRLILTGVRGLK